MRKFLIGAFIGSFIFTGCTQEELFENGNGMDYSVSQICSRSAEINDTTTCDSLPMPLLKDHTWEGLMSSIPNNGLMRAATTQADIDFGYNMVSLSGQPISIRCNTNTGKRFWQCDAAGKEVTLNENQNTYDNRQIFYFRKMASYTGFNYMLYSKCSDTPLAVGSYSDGTHVLMAAKTSQITSGMFYEWDLIPRNNSLFTIQSESYTGKDTNNSVFYYTVENINDRLQYGKYNTSSNAQKFYIEPIDYYALTEISFNMANATVTEVASIKKTFVLTNTTNNTVNKPIDSPFTVNEQSTFIQDASPIKIKLARPKRFVLPTVISGQIAMPYEGGTIVPYANNAAITPSKEISLNRTIEIGPRRMAEVTVEIKVYNIRTSYTGKAFNGNTEIHISGIWIGKVIPDVETYTPEITTKYKNLDGTEIEL